MQSSAKRRSLQIIAAALFMLSIVMSIVAPKALAGASLAAPAPELVLPTLTGPEFSLAALKGKVVLLHFWATWCPGCREEMPVLDQFYQQHRAQGLELIGVSVDRLRDRDDVVKFMHAFHFPTGIVGEAKANGFGTPRALPLTYVIDKLGVVRKIFDEGEPALTAAMLTNAVQPLLATGRAKSP